MGCCICSWTFFLLFVLPVLVVVYKIYKKVFSAVPIPKLDTEKYWGPGNKTEDESEVKPFKVSSTPEQINKLKAQLADTDTIQEPLEDTCFEYGFNANKLRKIVKYWKDDYLSRWDSRLEYLNKFPQFTTNVQGLDIHYLHVNPVNVGSKRVIPMIILHGWPGSVREFYEIIPKLVTPNDENDFVFEVIAPSLPGYAWSQAASKKGFTPANYATVLRNLMLKLKFDRFVVQGGDWGSIVGNYLATLYPNNVIGYHSNMCMVSTPLSMLKLIIASWFPSKFVKEGLEDFHFPLMPKFKSLISESGYFHIQATKPETIGTAVASNPIGLAAYILEKFSTGVTKDNIRDPEGGLDKTFPMDALLDNIMIYYLSKAFPTSVRIYCEGSSKAQTKLKMDRVQCNVPMGVCRFKNDLHSILEWALKDKFLNVVHSSYHRNGGHFAALEVPDVLYQDFVQFVNKIKENGFKF